MPIYAFGSNGSGQLGIGHVEDTSIPRPCHVSALTLEALNVEVSFQRRHGFAAGGNKTYIISDDGMVFGSGQPTLTDDESEASQSQEACRFRPLELLHDLQVKLCSATWDAVFFVDYCGNLYTTGLGSKGELGIGKDILASDKLTKVGGFPVESIEIIDISSSVSHTVCVLSNGDAYGWGNGRKGQIGEPAEIVWIPRKIASLDFKVVRTVCGKDFTCLFGDDSAGQCVILGSDKWGVRTSALAAIPGWKEVGASWGSIFVLDSGGDLTSWGRNDRGQLGPAHPPKLRSMAVGSEHVIAVTMDNEIIAWGWGEHGNCGPATDPDGNVNGTFIIIATIPLSDSGTALHVEAGCATSFIFTSEKLVIRSI